MMYLKTAWEQETLPRFHFRKVQLGSRMSLDGIMPINGGMELLLGFGFLFRVWGRSVCVTVCLRKFLACLAAL